MKVELNKRDLLTLLFGTNPGYDRMKIVPEELGHFVGGMIEGWYWNNSGMFSKEAFEREYGKYTEEYIWELYQKCKGDFLF